jgi:hypothetical protein
VVCGWKFSAYFGSIFIDGDNANDSLDKTDKKAGGVAGSLGGIVGKAALVGTAIVAGAGIAIGAITGLATKTADYASELDDLSKRTNINVEELQKWKYAIEQSGGDVGKLEGGIKTLSDTMVKAMDGNAATTDSFAKLGISVDDLKNKSQEDIFSMVVAGLADMEDGADKNALGNDLLGKSFLELKPMLDEGSQGIDDLKNKASELGLVMSEDAVAAGEQFGDTMDTLKASFGAAFMSIGSEFIPILQTMMDWVIAHMPEIKDGFSAAFDVIGTIFSTAGEWIQTFIGWVQSWSSENSGQLEGIKTLFTGLFESIGAFISSFIEWVKIVWATYGEDIIAILQTSWDYIVEVFSFAITLITDIFNVFAALFSGDWDKLWESVKKLFYDIVIGVQGVWEKVFKVLGEVFDLFKTAFKTSWDTTWENIKTVFENIWNGIKDFFVGVWEGIVGTVKDNVNLVIGLINMMIGAINGISFTIPDWVPEIGGDTFGFDIPEIPMLAKGGKVTGSGSFISGEAGAELISLNADGVTVTPLTDQEKEVGKGYRGSGGITQNITINSNKPLTPSEIARKALQASRQLALEWGV